MVLKYEGTAVIFIYLKNKNVFNVLCDKDLNKLFQSYNYMHFPVNRFSNFFLTVYWEKIVII